MDDFETTERRVIACIKALAIKYGGNIALAKRKAREAVRALPEYKAYTEALVDRAIDGMLYACRHQDNVTMKRNAGSYGQPAKVRVGDSPAVRSVADSIYMSMKIGGTMLGLLNGERLQQLADSERAIGAGHYFNADLCESLAKIVPAESRVKDVLTEAKLRKIGEPLRAKHGVGGTQAG